MCGWQPAIAAQAGRFRINADAKLLSFASKNGSTDFAGSHRVHSLSQLLIMARTKEKSRWSEDQRLEASRVGSRGVPPGAFAIPRRFSDIKVPIPVLRSNAVGMEVIKTDAARQLWLNRKLEPEPQERHDRLIVV